MRAAAGLPGPVPTPGQTGRRSPGTTDDSGKDFAHGDHGARHRAAEGSSDERLEPESSRHRVDQTHHDVPGEYQHGGHLEPCADPTGSVGHRGRRPGDLQPVADSSGTLVRPGPARTTHLGVVERRPPGSQRPGVPLPRDQHQPRSALGPYPRGVRRRSLSDLPNGRGIHKRNARRQPQIPEAGGHCQTLRREQSGERPHGPFRDGG